MNGMTDQARSEPPPVPWTGWLLLGSTMVVLVGAGGLLWWRHGAAVFGDYVVAALAWCF